MAAGAVYVAVLQFLGRSLANADDLYIEVQGLVRQRMVAVERDHVADDGSHREQANAVAAPRLKLHTLLYLAGALQGALRYALNQRRVMHPVPILGRYHHGQRSAVLFALESLFQAGHEIAVALNVGERLAAGGAIDDGALVVFHG